MKAHMCVSTFCLIVFVFSPQWASGGNTEKKQEMVRLIEKRRTELIELSDRIWRFAETALRETQSAKLLADHAEQQGFRVERGLAGMPTAFIATYGEGRPIIGIVGEYDALPGLSQKAVPFREALLPGGAGHGCGHNLFGAASLRAAVAVKELIAAGKLKGTIRFYGTPAEEAVGGKPYMAREGLFDDLDIALAPGTRTIKFGPTRRARRQSWILLWSSEGRPRTLPLILGTAGAPSRDWKFSLMGSTSCESM